MTYRARAAVGAGPATADGPPAWLTGYARDLDIIELGCTFDRLLSSDDAEAWATRTPEGFTVDVQAFRALTRHVVRRSEIPPALRRGLRRDRDRVRPADLLGVYRYDLWERFRRSLEPLRRAGKLGTVVLRFPTSFVPDLAGRAFLSIVGDRLPGDRLAAELPAAWFARDHLASTVALLRELRIGIVSGLGSAAGIGPDEVPSGVHVAAVRLPARSAAGVGRPQGWQRSAPRRRVGRQVTPGSADLHVLLSGHRRATLPAARRLREVAEAPQT